MDRARNHFFSQAAKLVAYLVESQILSSQYVKIWNLLVKEMSSPPNGKRALDNITWKYPKGSETEGKRDIVNTPSKNFYVMIFNWIPCVLETGIILCYF